METKKNWRYPNRMVFKGEYDKTAMEGNLADFPGPVRLQKVDETPDEALWDHLVREYHYLGSEAMIGSRAKYLITLGDRLVGAISFCSAAYKLANRDLFIGWDEEIRLRYLPGLLNNNRFLILPWVRVRNLASHALALALRRVSSDWKSQYGVEAYMVETFVDGAKYRGTCYIAANWTYLGTTKGFGRMGNSFVFHGNRKDLYVMVMSRRFARLFKPDTGRLPNVRAELLKTIKGLPTCHANILNGLGATEITPGSFEQILAEHLAPYLPFLGRKEHSPHFATMIKGLLSDLERKSIEPIALALVGKSKFRSLAKFMTQSLFDNEGMLEEYQRQLASALSAPGGMITGDGRDFPKQGNKSVGVQLQYCDRLGKVENCQASVMLGYASPKGYGLADYRLYMPKKWFDDERADLRKKCLVPESLEYKSKNVMLFEMINKIYASGLFECKYVGVDSDFGSDPDFLDSLPEGLVYFAEVPRNLHAFERRIVVPEPIGGGGKPSPTPSFAPKQVSEIAADPSVPWKEVILGIGAKGPIVAKDKLVRVVEARNGMPGKEVWLYVRRLEDESLKYALCNESPGATVEEIRAPALTRWSIKRCFHECEKYLGMDHYELRSWTGWRRHMLFTFIAHLFVNKLRRKYGIAVDTPGSGPIVEAPVPLIATHGWVE
jgi:SRSO17 transposase